MTINYTQPVSIVGGVAKSLPVEMRMVIRGRDNSFVVVVFHDLDATGKLVQKREVKQPLRTWVYDETTGDPVLDEQGNPVLDDQGNPVKIRSTMDKIWTNHITLAQYRAVKNFFMDLVSGGADLGGGAREDAANVGD